METKKLIPALRFKGFTEEWQEQTMSKLGKHYNGLSGKTKNDFGHGDAKFITYMNVFSNPIADLQRTENVEIDNKQNSVKYGDVLFTVSSETPEEVGMSSVWLGEEDNIYLNSFCFGYRLDEVQDPYYVAYLLRSKSIRNKISFLAQGISRYNISKNRVMEIYLPFPCSDEQKSIGKYFANIDKLIEKSEAKLAKLKSVKKGCLAKMFPTHGSTTPALRFKGFAEDWQCEKLDSIFDIGNGYTPSKANPNFWENGTIPWFRMEDIRENGRVLSDSFQHITPEAVKSSGLFPAESFIISTTATIGEHALIIVDSLANQQFNFLTKKLNRWSELDVMYFLYQMYSLCDWCKANTNAGGLAAVSMNDLRNYVFIIPKTKAEQQKIGEYFKKLDELITKTEQRIEKLRNIKKACLAKMFV